MIPPLESRKVSQPGLRNGETYRADQNNVRLGAGQGQIAPTVYVALIVALQYISEIISFPDDLRIATNATVDKIPDVTQR